MSSVSSEIMDAYWAAPPLARTLTTAIVVTSISVHLGLLSPVWIYFTEDRLFRLPPEIWRLATNFFLSGPQIGIIMDPYFGNGRSSISPGDECCLTRGKQPIST
jgi:Derlin-2/3